ncbi:MAG TPA: SAVED domain-containing protein [Stellaceae bacterium]|nr:SAVED domain-containing protein [Stellaceae bacterium]
MTDATGRSFLSYRRTRIEEARLLIEAQHDVGIPTWHDVSEFEEGQTESLLRDALADPTTANAVCWLTPEVEASAVITRTELPGILRRIRAGDGFFMIPVAAGGVDYPDVTRIAGTYLGMHDLGGWNLRKVVSDPIGPADAAIIARQVLGRRIRTVVAQLAADAPLRLVINTQKKPAFASGVALALDWTHRFDGRLTHRPESWQEQLIPALETVAQAITERAPGRRIVAEGLCALPTAVAFGTAFLATRGMSVGWRQISPNREPELWSLGMRPEPCGFVYQVGDGDPSADDLALPVSVASNVEPAFAASRPNLPKMRAIVVVHCVGAYPHDLATAGQARDLVRIIVEALRYARDQYQPRGTLHLFLAVPAGLAMLIGQMLNTFGPVQAVSGRCSRFLPCVFARSGLLTHLK